jgi:hypothetical protein
MKWMLMNWHHTVFIVVTTVSTAIAYAINNNSGVMNVCARSKAMLVVLTLTISTRITKPGYWASGTRSLSVSGMSVGRFLG